MLKHSYVSGKVKVNRSGIDHRGVFAVEPIRKNEIIAVWGGFIISQSEFVKLEKTCFKEIENYATRVADGFFLVSC
ncbi:MAG: hypothetical protein PHE11_07220, partial [Candidatus Omnitrophica bacterium]|nr:hypothetical protein [Candidatus Omnitrophota bacterium]